MKIHDKTYRTVSANYGMSYSISNVMAQSGIDRLLSLLPTSFAEDMVRDYVGNKMLNPGYVPEIDSELCIEQALAITALELSMKQHLDMHFNTVEIGFLDKVKSFTRDPFYDQMYQEKVLEGKRFHHSDVKLIIGAGGVISHAPKREQALYMMLRGFRAEGVTEVWRDNNFISPHLGKLSDVDEGEAFRLLMEECYEKLGTVINPSVKSKRMNRKVMTATIDGVKISLNKNEVRYLPIDKKVSVEIVLEEEATIRGIDKVIKFETDFPLLLMTYSHRDLDFSVLMNELKLYNFSDESFHIQTKTFALKNYIEEGDFELSLDLPYKGSILFEKGDKVTSDQIYGVNKFALPKLYIISLTKLLGNHFDSNMMRNQLMLRVGDFLDFDQQIMGMAHSPIKGVIKSINYDTGTILAQEIQDYTEKPITINFAKRLNIKPKSIYGYLKKGKNDFVFEGERLNKLNSKSATTIIKAPITGNLVDIDSKKGTVTIQYKITPNEHKIGLNCEVTDVREYMGLDVKYSGSRVQGKIGFGKQMNGELIYCSNLNDITAVMKKVVVYNGKVDSKILKRLEKAGIHGLVIPTISNRELVEFISEEIGIALTGKEKIQFPLILMKGFGEASFDDDFLELVKNSEGKSALLLPITQIRAGVTRPTIIIT
ncbi:MAG: hypothetical protein B6226_04300 [Candidatus Cloacimonetes bacterium 4572_65]|nr:MAG: hypothetical protein B6226_04300 [Candidatus Cloacimonetes bacterium 4572_65]